MKTVVLVPRRKDKGHRDGLWNWIKKTHWKGYKVFEGYDEGPHPFNRSRAINRAAQEAGEWDVALIADADTYVPVDQRERAVLRAARSNLMVIAYDRFRYISEEGTKEIRKGYDGSWEPYVEWEMTGTVSSCIAVPRELWNRSGGFDSGFQGWGCEDVAFFTVCANLIGYDRLHGDCWHFWHPPSMGDELTRAANVERLKRYEVARDEGCIEDLLEEIRRELFH